MQPGSTARASELENSGEAARFEDIIDLCGSAVAYRIWTAGCRAPRYQIPLQLRPLKRMVGPDLALIVHDNFGGLVLNTTRCHDDMEQLYAGGIRRDRAAGMSVKDIMAKHRIEDGAFGNPIDISFVQRVLGIRREEG